MKRSEINTYIDEAIAFFADHQFHLPPWGYWSPEEWKEKAKECGEIVENKLGWDVTDFGMGDFHDKGLLLFTIRNGKPDSSEKPYCEKIMIVREKQLTPFHYHWIKTEDIINRGGGNLALELCQGNEKNEFVDTAVTVTIDSIERTVEARGKIVLGPGESVCLPPYLYHAFYGEKGSGDVLVGEVSKVNDDDQDNNFYGGLPRFPEIEEDEAPRHLLVTDYTRYV